MAQNAIQQALQQASQTTGRRKAFNTSDGGLNLRPGTYQSEYQGDSGLAAAMSSFVQSAGAAHGAHDDFADRRGKERSDEIIRKFTPEQRKEAREQGVLLYQDDPYAMRHLAQATGFNAAHEIDQEVNGMISRGEIKDRKAYEDIRQERLDKGGKTFAEMNGLSFDDPEFQRGFNSNITERNAALVDSLGRKRSQDLMANAAIQNRSNIGSLLSDQSFLQSPEAATALTGYINNGMTTGSIPTTADAVGLLRGALQDATARPGGVFLLFNMAGQKIRVGGQDVDVVDVVGADTLENLKAKAAHFEQSTKADRAERFQGQLSGIMARTDTVSALSALDTLHSQTVGATPTDVMTPERQAILSARDQLLNRQRAETVKLQTEAVKNQQFQVQVGMQLDAYERKLNGEMVSTDTRLMPTTAETGKWRHEEVQAYAANLKMNQIASWDLPESEKTNLMLQYVKADRKDGPFRKIMGEFVDSASAEWQGAVISGATQRDYPQLNRLRELSKADPVSIAMLYPEKADLVAKLNAMDRYGIDMSVAVEAEKAQSKLTREERNQQARDFTTMIRKSKSAAQYMPAEMNEMARTIYEANVSLTGNLSAAQSAVEAFVETNTAQFKTTGETMGAVFKTDILMDTNDVTSWKAGQSAIQAKLDAFSQARPELTANGGAFVMSRNGQLFIQTLLGPGEPLYMQDIREENARAVAQEREDAKRRQQDDIKRTQEGFKPYEAEREERARKVRDYPNQDKP